MRKILTEYESKLSYGADNAPEIAAILTKIANSAHNMVSCVLFDMNRAVLNIQNGMTKESAYQSAAIDESDIQRAVLSAFDKEEGRIIAFYWFRTSNEEALWRAVLDQDKPKKRRILLQIMEGANCKNLVTRIDLSEFTDSA